MDQITTTLWVCEPEAADLIKIEVVAPTNERSIAAAQAVWQALRRAGYHMHSTPPDGQTW